MTKHRLSQHLTMRQAAQLLNWVGTTGQPTTADMRRVKYHLRVAERTNGRRLVFGGGRLGRRGGGGRCWTTINALRHADLLDDYESMAAEVGERINELYEMIELLGARQNGVARVLGKQRSQLTAIARKLGVSAGR